VGVFRAQGHAEGHHRDRATLSLPPEALGAFVKASAKKWWPLINKFGINAE
jgi:hypothetical protein